MSRVTPRHNILSNPLHNTGQSQLVVWLAGMTPVMCRGETPTFNQSFIHQTLDGSGPAWLGEVIKCIHQTQISALRIF